MPPRPLLAIGAPRSGFTLLTSVLVEVRAATGARPTRRQRVLRAMEATLGRMVADRIEAAFREAGLGERLLYNDNFKRLSGGPRWLEPARGVVFRKYFGVAGLGDFTVLTRHPVGLLEADEVVHSHSGAAAWPSLHPFTGHLRFASVRNPFGVLNSAVFSLNALTSEYLQRAYPPGNDAEPLRQRLAVYKLTDRRFFASLAAHLARELEAYLPHRGRYTEMRWEDLILHPAASIRRLGEAAESPVSEAQAKRIWRRIGHRNLTGAHRHNFREGHGRVGDWKRWLVDEHLEMARATGLAPLMRELGYDPGERIDPASHTPFQRTVAAALAAGQAIDETADRDLFTFAFNKTNIDFSQFGFRIGEWRAHTRVERSCFRDEALERRVWDAAEAACAAMNAFLDEFLALDFDRDDVRPVLERHEKSLATARFAQGREAILAALSEPRRSILGWLRR
ncbi:MAG TPA: hypothetical protein VFC18_13600 [Burkholderiales bacterium]|nr:hypothetical protein [Burkholderiales bacterium]